MGEKRKKKEARRAARKGAAKTQRRAHAYRDADGKTHLVIQRDALGRPQRLALSRPLFNEQWQNEVAVAAAASAHGLLSEAHTLDQTVALAHKALTAASKIAEGALDASPDHKLACQAGCAHCCYQAVGVTAPEVFAIYAHLQATRTPSELEATATRLRVADDTTRGMASAERLSPNLPCPFLETERCSIYEVRPLACRGQNSLDAALCERTLHDADARAQRLAGTLPVPCYLEPIRASHAVTAGIQLSLHELHGLQMLPLELTAAMRVLIDDPESVPRKWLAREDPFRAARGGDSTDDPHIRALSGRR